MSDWRLEVAGGVLLDVGAPTYDNGVLTFPPLEEAAYVMRARHPMMDLPVTKFLNAGDVLTFDLQTMLA